jgi:hypothetical protein
MGVFVEIPLHFTLQRKPDISNSEMPPLMAANHESEFRDAPIVGPLTVVMSRERFLSNRVSLKQCVSSGFKF